MYLEIFLADFAVFRVFWGISRDFAEMPEFRGSATARNIRSPDVDKNAKIVIESDLCTNVPIFALMNVSSHYWSLFHINDCIFSCNEHQKV